MKRRIYLIVISIFFSLFFGACDSKIVDPLTANYHMQFVSINTIAEGAVLVGNSQIPVSLLYDPDVEIFPDKVVLSVHPFSETEKEPKPLVATSYFYFKNEDNYFREGLNPAVVQAQKEAELQASAQKQKPVSPNGKAPVAVATSVAPSPEGGNAPEKGGQEVAFDNVDPLLLKPTKGEVGAKYLIEFPLLKQKAGLYHLRIEFFHEDRSLGKRELFFFFADRKIKINSLEIHPAVAYPSGEILLQPQLVGILKDQGYLRLYFKNRLIFAGTPEALGKKLIIEVPQEVGVYPLLLEAFPQQPSEEMEEFPFASPYSIKSDIFVNEQQTALAGDFPDGNHYLLLHHFRGELNNVATGKGKVKSMVTGKPLLSMSHGFLGYNFGYDHYLYYDAFLLPQANGQLQPFSLHLSAHFLREKVATLFESSTENFRFELKRDLDRLPFALFYYGGRVFCSKIPTSFSPEELVFRPLTLSVYTYKDETQLLWYRDGQLFYADQLPVSFSQLGSSASGKSYLGKSKGESGVIDEFAIYYQDKEGRASIDETIFETNLEKRVKKSLLYAQGFDGISLAKKKLAYHGKVELNASALVLSGGSEASFDFACEGERTLNVAVDLTLKKAKAKLLLQAINNEKEESLLLFDFDKGFFSFQNQEVPLFFEEEGVLSFSISQKEDQWLLTLANHSFEFPLKQLPTKMRLKALVASESSPLSMNAVVVDSLSRPQELIEYRKSLLLPLKK